jgi:hypothetical protein
MPTEGVTDGELNDLRDAQGTFMPQSVVIRRRAYDGDQGYEQGNIATAVPCRLTPGAGSWQAVSDRLQGITPFIATVPWNQELQAGDTIVDEQARTFEVRAVKSPSTYLTAKQALCDLVNDG